MASLLLAVIYLVFVSLGLPDSLLGSAWPTMQIDFSVPSSYAGYVSMTVCFMTIISSLVSPKIINKIQTKWIVVFSVMLTILGLLGFSFSTKYYMLFIFAIPYGLGAGAIDASMNHYVANNYSGSVMSFLHCFYGLGAVISPNIMALALKYAHWNEGYLWTSFVQMGILFVCLISLPLWKTTKSNNDEIIEENAGIRKTLFRPGVILTMIAFFGYCSGEATCFLWTSSYFSLTKNNINDELIASFGSLVFFGLTAGRIFSGFSSNRLGDRLLIRIGIGIELLGLILILLPLQTYVVAAIGFVIVGFGMGPIYPSIQHMTPINFGRKYSASAIGLQMASAYVGSTFTPMIFGLLQQKVGIWIMPYFVLFFALINIAFLEVTYLTIKKTD